MLEYRIDTHLNGPIYILDYSTMVLSDRTNKLNRLRHYSTFIVEIQVEAHATVKFYLFIIRSPRRIRNTTAATRRITKMSVSIRKTAKIKFAYLFTCGPE